MFCEGSIIWHEKPEEGWRTYRPKRCEYNKDEVNSSNILSDNKLSSIETLKSKIAMLQMKRKYL